VPGTQRRTRLLQRPSEVTSRYLGFIQEWLSTAPARRCAATANNLGGAPSPTVVRIELGPLLPETPPTTRRGSMSSTDSGCAACQRYGELTDFSCPEQWVRSHRNVQPRRRALRTPLAAPTPSRITGRRARPRPDSTPSDRCCHAVESGTSATWLVGPCLEAEALPGTAGSGTRRPQITFPATRRTDRGVLLPGGDAARPPPTDPRASGTAVGMAAAVG
jgi:hypothetical protein